MANRHIDSLQKTKAVLLRYENHPLSTISELTGISPATLKRFFCDPRNVEVILNSELVKRAKAEIASDMDPDNETAQVMTRLKASVIDQIDSHSANVSRLTSITKKMNPQTSDDVVKYSRAVSAEGAAIKNLVELLKAHEDLFEYEDLPELVMRVMNDDDVQRMRAQQEAEDELMSH